MDETRMESVQLKEKRGPLFVPSCIVLVGAAIMIMAFFLPFASATGAFREYLKSYPSVAVDEGVSITNGQMVEMSLLEILRVYTVTAKMGKFEGISIICVVLISLVALFSLLVLLFAIFKKPVPLLIFNCLAMAPYYLLCWDFKDRGVVPSYNYKLGISYYLYYAAAVVILVGAVYLLVENIRLKKREKV